MLFYLYAFICEYLFVVEIFEEINGSSPTNLNYIFCIKKLKWFTPQELHSKNIIIQISRMKEETPTE